MAEEFRVLRPKEYHSHLVSQGQRADGRGLEETREVKLEVDAIRTADSSSLIKLGNTSLVCGCTSRMVPSTNEDDDPLKVRIELPPICSNPTGQRIQHAEQLLTKTIRNIMNDSNCLDKDVFYMDKTNHTWSVNVEVICLNHDGCLMDAAIIAILSSLQTLLLSNEHTDGNVRRIKFNSLPICSTFAIINDVVVCDPNLEEEGVAQTCFSITIDAMSDRLCHISKLGGKALNLDILTKCIKLAKNQAKAISSLLPFDEWQVKMDTQ